MNTPENLSEEYIREHCPHCDASSDAFTHVLQETDHFRIVCDHHPLLEGHILIIPTQHLSCLGEYPDSIFKEFTELDKTVSTFVREQYGSVSTFEHGKLGQTVFHSHIHYLPFAGDPLSIIPEGMDRCIPVSSFEELGSIFQRFGRYLFFSIGDRGWVVDPSLAVPRFFRDRFAVALGVPERGNWKDMHMDEKLMVVARAENEKVKMVWDKNH